MGVYKCPDCGNLVSEHVEKCMHCSCPIDEVKKNNQLITENRANEKIKSNGFANSVMKNGNDFGNVVIEKTKNIFSNEGKKKKIIIAVLSLVVILVLFFCMFGECDDCGEFGFLHTYKILGEKQHVCGDCFDIYKDIKEAIGDLEDLLG